MPALRLDSDVAALVVPLLQLVLNQQFIQIQVFQLLWATVEVDIVSALEPEPLKRSPGKVREGYGNARSI